MRKYEMEMVKSRKLVEIVCDRCGKSFESDLKFDGVRGSYGLNEFQLSWRWGDHYPEGGSGEKIQVELCRGCRGWLRDLLDKEGVKLRSEDWDF